MAAKSHTDSLSRGLELETLDQSTRDAKNSRSAQARSANTYHGGDGETAFALHHMRDQDVMVNPMPLDSPLKTRTITARTFAAETLLTSASLDLWSDAEPKEAKHALHQQSKTENANDRNSDWQGWDRNHWERPGRFLFCYALFNLFLFVLGFLRQAHQQSYHTYGSEDNGTKAMYTTLSFVRHHVSWWVLTAKGFGMILNFNASIIFLPVCRNLMSQLRATVIVDYFPVDNAIAFHIIVAKVLAVSTFLHGGCHYANLYATDQPDLYFQKLRPAAYSTGVTLAGIMCVMYFCTWRLIKRNTKGFACPCGHTTGFNIFWYSHHLYVAFCGILLYHGPIYWVWALYPVGTYIFERVYIRRLRSRQFTELQSFEIWEGDVMEVRLLNERFMFKPGQYCFLNCDEIAAFDWHPFTISSAPHEEGFTCHIKWNGVGSWTYRLWRYLEKLQTVRSNIRDQLVLRAFLAFQCRESVSEMRATSLRLYGPRPSQLDLWRLKKQLGSLLPNSKAVHISELDEDLQFSSWAEVVAKLPGAPVYFVLKRGSGKSQRGTICDSWPEPKPNSQWKFTARNTVDIVFDDCQDQKKLFTTHLRNVKLCTSEPAKWCCSVMSPELADMLLRESHWALDHAFALFQMSYTSGFEMPLKEAYSFLEKSAFDVDTALSNWNAWQRSKGLPSRKLYIPGPFLTLGLPPRQRSGAVATLADMRLSSVAFDADPLLRQELEQCSTCWRQEVLSACPQHPPKTSSLHSSCMICKKLGRVQTPLRVDGPFGSPTERVFEFRRVVLVGAGIGVTPMASVLKHISHRMPTTAAMAAAQLDLERQQDFMANLNLHHTRPSIIKDMKLEKVTFIWLFREWDGFEWFSDLLPQLTRPEIDIQLYRTRAKESGTSPNRDATPVRAGRPKWDSIFDKLVEENPSEHIGIFFCGNKQVAQTLLDKTIQLNARFKSGESSTHFTFHKESF